MKIGIYPGSFNPIHNGHLAIANYIAEYVGYYDEVWFLITPQSPHKRQDDMLSKELRLQLVEKAIEGYSKFKTCTIEWDMPQPCYTVNTLQKLRIAHPTDTFELIIGADNWESFHRWKDYKTIINNFNIFVYPRKGHTIYFNHPNVSTNKNVPQIDISSSFIRKSIRKEKDVRFFMPVGIYEEVLAANVFVRKEEDSLNEETTPQEKK